MIYYFIVIAGVFACSVSQLLLKKSASTKHRNAIGEIMNWRVIVSYGIMLLTLITNIFAMSKGVNLKDMPIMEALGYIFVPLLSFFYLKESISKNSLISIAFIIAGILVFYI